MNRAEATAGPDAEAVIFADRAGVIRYWGGGAEAVFGHSAADALGNSLDLIIPERLRERHWSGFNDVMATGHTSYGDRLLEVPALHADGRRMSIAFTVTLVRGPAGPEDESPTAIAAVLRDDTERWQERRQMREEMARMRAESGESAESAEGS